MRYDLIRLNESLNPFLSALYDYNDLNEEDINSLKKDEDIHYSSAKCILDTVEVLKKARKENKKVFIGGDYDADGICATSILKYTLNKFGIESGFYVPNRLIEGYGLNEKTVIEASNRGYEIIITVDNGVKAKQALKKAKELNIFSIVSDHHIIEEEVECDILVHNSTIEEEFINFCGSGIAMLISRALIGNDEYVNSLAMVGTIGDVMKLTGQNRAIVKKGLSSVNKNKYKQFFDLIDKDFITSIDISFSMVPKLNSMGRMKDVNNLIRYFFLDENNNKYLEKLDDIKGVDSYRKILVESMSDKAYSLLDDEDFIIIYDESFIEGLSGILAGRLSKEFNKPTIVFAKNKENLKGSARGLDSFDLYEFFKEDFSFIQFGGHKKAVGIEIKESYYLEFKNKVIEKYKNIVKLDYKEKAYLIDEKAFSLEKVKDLLRLAPFGEGFKLPLIAIENPTILNSFIIKDKYLKYNSINYETICFDSKYKNIEDPSLIIGEISINKFKNSEKISLNLLYIE